MNEEPGAKEQPEEEKTRLVTGSVQVSIKVGALKRALRIWTKHGQKCFDESEGISF